MDPRLIIIEAHLTKSVQRALDQQQSQSHAPFQGNGTSAKQNGPIIARLKRNDFLFVAPEDSLTSGVLKAPDYMFRTVV